MRCFTPNPSNTGTTYSNPNNTSTYRSSHIRTTHTEAFQEHVILRSPSNV